MGYGRGERKDERRRRIDREREGTEGEERKRERNKLRE